MYQHFGSHAGLLQALASATPLPSLDPKAGLQAAVAAACRHWASDPALFRRLPAALVPGPAGAHELAIALAQADGLRPGCSVREAEDVIGLLTSFGAFDRLHNDGRRSAGAVAEILVRMGGSILAEPPA